MDPDASQTFHGRDVFAPAAAQIAASRAGGPWDGRYFRRIEFNSLRSLSIPALTLDGDEITGEVLYIDHFGNIITSIGRLTWRGDQSALVFDPLLNAGLPKLIVSALSTIRVGNHTFEQIQHTYGEVNPGDSLTLIGSSKHLEIAINQGNAAQQLRIAIGDSVTLHIAEDT
jgi:S-adenosylmethionine hydrolase